MAMDFLLAGDRATRRGEGCSGIERPLARFELERTREQKKPYLAKRASWRRHSQSLSERLGSTYDTGFIFQRCPAQLRNCHKCFSHYRQPPSVHQSIILIFERFAAANAKALIYLDLVHPTYGPPQLLTIDTLQYSCVVGSDRIINMHVRGVSLIV